MAKRTESAVLITIPVGTGHNEGYEIQKQQAGAVPLSDGRRTHIDIMLGPDEAAVFASVKAALCQQAAKLNDGKPVHNNNDVLRWVFQQVLNAK